MSRWLLSIGLSLLIPYSAAAQVQSRTPVGNVRGKSTAVARQSQLPTQTPDTPANRPTAGLNSSTSGTAPRDRAGAATLTPSTAPTQRTATNLTKFGIPFSIADEGNRFIEVQLYVSKDRGQSWQFAGRQNTSDREFPFESSGNGTYWFALRTLDRDRRLHPDGPMNGELEVVVDAVDPELDFRVQTDAAGRLVCRWRATDEDLDLSSIKLSFRPLLSINDQENVWIPVPYRAVTPISNGVFADQYAWWPETSAHEVLVQLQISDRAGNTAVEERQVVVGATAARSQTAAMAVKGASDPVSATVLPQARQQSLKPDPAAPNPETLAAGTSASKPAKPDIPWEPRGLSGSRNQRTENTTWPVQPDQRPVMSDLGPSESATPASQSPALNPITSNETGGPSRDLSQPVVETAGRTAEPSPPGTALTPPARVTADPRGLPPTSLASSVLSGPTTRPAALSDLSPEIDSLNSRRFLLNYDLERLAAPAIDKVVLWVTRDNGNQWESYGEDPDRQSPFPVELPGPGVYGFRVVFQTVDGLVGHAPGSGDKPDYQVRVDLEPPQAQLTAAPYGRGPDVGCLMIQWTAGDERLATKPISLFYSTTLEGPWTTIVAGTDHTGTYPWRVGAEVPERIYLRLQVADAAGNLTFSQTNQPLDLSGLIPKARITGVEPVR